jgi:hypothetical protein
MKSKKVREFIEKISNRHSSNVIYNFYKIVELAETEMREKAIGAHRKWCKQYSNGECLQMEGESCDDDCGYMNRFRELIDKTE